MSAYLVAKETIDLILSAAIETKLYWECEYLSADRAESIGLDLWAENAKSVGYRYGERPDDVSEYRLAKFFNVNLQAAIGCIRCLDYQSCEHEGWEASNAKKFLNACMWHFATKLAGESAPWGVDGEDEARRYASGPIATPSPAFIARARAELQRIQRPTAQVIPLRPAPPAAPIADRPLPVQTAGEYQAATKRARAPRKSAAFDREEFKRRLVARLSK